MAIGIDVSEHQGKINWNITKKYVKFAMLRAGLGKGIEDKQFVYNADSCTREGIPFGIYWFSYAFNENDAKYEAIECVKRISKYEIIYPVAYDFEYATETNGEKYGVKYTKELRTAIIDTFCKTISEYGYEPMVYTNWDYWIYRGINQLYHKYDLWFASYTDKKPNLDIAMWQYSCKGEINGIYDNKVDMNNCYEDYIKIYEDKNINNIEESWIDYYFDKNKNPNAFKNYKMVIDSYFNGDVNAMELADRYKCDYNLVCFLIKKIKEKREKWRY